MVAFDKLQSVVAEQKGFPIFREPFIAVDPGETTGLAYFNPPLVANDPNDTWVIDSQEIATPDLTTTIEQFTNVIKTLKPTVIVIEEYLVYQWKTKDHAWSDLHTPRVIAAIEVLATQHSISTHKQMAHAAKTFCTDAKLKEWNFYIKGKKHARDAIRHGCYFILFNHQKVESLR